MRTGILLFKDAEELDFAGPFEVFGIASKLTNKAGPVTVSKDGSLIQCSHGLRVQPDHSFSNCPPLDLLIVPGGRGARESALLDEDTLSFVRMQASKAQVASVCTGALVLAKAGVLDGHKATTHHAWIEALQKYPKVQVVPGARYVREGNVSSSAGITAGIDLALEIVREQFGDAILAEVTKEMEYERAPRMIGSSKRRRVPDGLK